MYVRWTILMFALGTGAVYVWQHPSAGRLIGGPTVVVNPHVTQEAVTSLEAIEDQRRYQWLIAAATLGVIVIFVAAVLDRLRLRGQRVEQFAYHIPMSMDRGDSEAAGNIDETADADPVPCLADAAES